jgi:SAM-dependent methyltransferase
MPDDAFWDFYWETRLQPMENLGKRAAILSASQLIRRTAELIGRPVRVLELGCGEGQVLGTLLDAHAQITDTRGTVGIDYNSQSLARCRRDYPGPRWIEGDFTDTELLTSLGKFDLVLLVNAFHEVFSSAYSPTLGEVDVAEGKRRVAHAFDGAAAALASGGWLVLFDGLEMDGDPDSPVEIHFTGLDVRREFDAFASGYQPFHITFRELQDPLHIVLSQRHFARYMDKSIFLGKPLWKTERLESYQYFTRAEFSATFARLKLKIETFQTLTINIEKWRHRVDTSDSQLEFPTEHILITAQNMD